MEGSTAGETDDDVKPRHDGKHAAGGNMADARGAVFGVATVRTGASV
jgi:hypothetical protein